MEELIEIIREQLDQELVSLDYSGYLLKKITTSSSISVDKPSKGYHIEITDTDGPMSLFPVVTSSKYLASRDTAEKRRFTLKLPVAISKKNFLNTLDGVEERAREKELSLKKSDAELEEYKKNIHSENSFNEYTICTFNERGSGQAQSEIGTSSDSKYFLGLRYITLPDEYLIFLKVQNVFKYVILSIPNIEDIPGLKEFFNQNGEYQVNSKDKSTLEGKDIIEEIEKKQDLEDRNHISNIIYYGPPGTGKTRRIQQEHLAGKDDSNSKFITFHQSYSYEEFIEGLKPLVVHSLEEIYKEKNLREFIKHTLKLLKDEFGWETISQNAQVKDSTIESTSYRGLRLSEFFGPSNIFGQFDEAQNSESLSSSGTQRFFEDPLQSEPGKYIYLTTQWSNVAGNGLTYKNFERFVSRISEGLYSTNQKGGEYVLFQQSEQNSNVVYKIIKGVFYESCEAAARLAGYSSLKECISDSFNSRNEKMKEAIKNGDEFVLCVDEINRANISAVFGDLITLIESKKRLGEVEEMSAILPYSKEKFGVPANLRVVGTMNTADRSVTLIDAALRRRFHFEEILPNPDVLKNIEIEDVNLSKMLDKINRRIAYFLCKDQTIGHSYFLDIKNSEKPKTKLLSIFRSKIIPLLEEYFYDDVSKIRLILGESNKPEGMAFYLSDRENEIEQLFGAMEEEVDIDDETTSYVKNEQLFDLLDENNEDLIDSEIFTKIYE